MDSLIRRKCQVAKEDWLTEKCEEIETLEKQHKMKKVHNKEKDMNNRNRRKAGSGCLVSKQGDMLFEDEAIRER